MTPVVMTRHGRRSGVRKRAAGVEQRAGFRPVLGVIGRLEAHGL